MATIGGYLRSFLGPTADQRADADHARDQKRELQALEKKLTQAHSRLAESYDYLNNIDPLERYRDGDDYGYGLGVGGFAGDRTARAKGDNRPVLNTIQDLRNFRGDARLLDATNGLATGFLDRLVDFVIGDGHQVDFSLRGVKRGAVATGVSDTDGDGLPEVDDAVARAQEVWDDWCHQNDWGCGSEDREPECYRRLERDGEVFLRFFEGDNGLAAVRFIEPEQIEPPAGAPRAGMKPGHDQSQEWSWGIETDTDDVETKIAYYVRPMDGLSAEFEGKIVSAREIVSAKLNTDRTIKRGVPSLTIVAEAFRQCEKINRNMAEVTAIQAAIAYVRQHAAGTMPSQITDLVKGGSDYQSTPGRTRRAGSDRLVENQITDPGTVLDMSAGMAFNSGPAATGTPTFIAALQSRLRGICARFGMPEFFTSDACHDAETELLTKRGWMRYDELLTWDEAGTMNPDTGEFEWQKIDAFFGHEHDGEMVRLSGSHSLDVLVTPNHRMYVARHRSERRGGFGAKIKRVGLHPFQFVPASELRRVSVLPMSCKPKGGVPVEMFELPGVPSNRYFISENSHPQPRLIPMTGFLKYLGWWISEGWTVGNGSSYGIGVCQSQSNKAEVGEIRECVKDIRGAGFNVRENIRKNGMATWTANDKSLWTWLRENCGRGSYSKRIPDFVWDLPACQQAELLHALIKGDGADRMSGSFTYFTVSRELADQVQSLAVQCGYVTNVQKPMNNGIIPIAIKLPTRDIKVSERHITREHHTGYVWCVSVKNGLLVTRRNGKAIVTGNSNANFASTLVAGGPFERSIKRKQKRFAGFVRAVAYKVLEFARDGGRLSADDFVRIEITVTPPGVTIANKLEETQIRQIEQQAGVLSVQTWQQQAGYDSRQEAANVKAFKSANPDQSGGGGMDFGGLFGGKPDVGEPAAESYIDDLFFEADRSHLVRKIITDSNGHKRAIEALLADDPPLANDPLLTLESHIDEELYDLLTEAGRAGLTKKTITDKNGKKRTVYVRSDDPAAAKRASKAFSKTDRAERVAQVLGTPANEFTPERASQFVADLSAMTKSDLNSLRDQVGLGKANARTKKGELVDGLTAYAKEKHATAAAERAKKPLKFAQGLDRDRSAAEAKGIDQAKSSIVERVRSLERGGHGPGAGIFAKPTTGSTPEEHDAAMKQLESQGVISVSADGKTVGFGKNWKFEPEPLSINPLKVMAQDVSEIASFLGRKFNSLFEAVMTPNEQQVDGLIDAYRLAVLSAYADDDFDAIAALLSWTEDSEISEGTGGIIIDEELYDLLTEAGRAGLTKKTITDKNGKKRTVYVRSGSTSTVPKKTPAIPAPAKPNKAAAKAESVARVKGVLAKPAGDLQPEDVQRLHADLGKLTVPELKVLQKEHGATGKGPKKELVTAIMQVAVAKYNQHQVAVTTGGAPEFPLKSTFVGPDDPIFKPQPKQEPTSHSPSPAEPKPARVVTKKPSETLARFKKEVGSFFRRLLDKTLESEDVDPTGDEMADAFRDALLNAFADADADTIAALMELIGDSMPVEKK